MQNLQQLFARSTSSLPTKTLSLLDGELTLFRRPNSANWQCRFKLANGQWHAASTATDDLDRAQTQAVAIYETVKAKIGSGLSPVSKTFKQVARNEMANMAQAKRAQQAVKAERARQRLVKAQKSLVTAYSKSLG